MSITISIPDALRQSVEAASGGKNTVLYDAKGYPSTMAVIPRFNVQDIDASLGTGTHPAFLVNGATKSEIFVGKFQAIVHDGNALALPGQDPTTSVNFDQARGYCAAKGPGWHLMTNAEWAAIAMWCWKNGTMPRGNTNWGKSSDVTYETGRRADGGEPGSTSGTGRTLTGSGPASWYHDNTAHGIADMNGNVWEWSGGLRLVDGEIQIIQDNNAADNTADQSSTSTLWRAIAQDGSLVAPGTAGTLKYDAGNADGSGVVQIDDVVDNQSDGTASASEVFESIAADTGITVPELMYQLGLATSLTGLGGDRLYMRNIDERLPRRGGAWYADSYAGVFALHLDNPRSHANSTIGFRPAFVL